MVVISPVAACVSLGAVFVVSLASPEVFVSPLVVVDGVLVGAVVTGTPRLAGGFDIPGIPKL